MSFRRLVLMDLDIQFLAGVCDWPQLLDATLAAEEAGFGMVWTLDHLSGSVFGTDSAFECFTLLGALASATSRIGLGSLVANVTNRHPGLLAVAASSVQEISGGRFVLGLGAGTSPSSPFAVEPRSLGITVAPTLAARHARLQDTLDLLDSIWADDRDPRWDGFAQPHPKPPTLLGVNSRALATIAGARTNGVNVASAHPDAAGIIHAARSARRPSNERWMTTTWSAWDGALVDPAHPERVRLEGLGVDRLVLMWPTAPDIDEIASVKLPKT